MPTIQRKYICNICKQQYDTNEQAENCEKEHARCVCEKEIVRCIAYKTLSWGKSTNTDIDFRTKEIQAYIDNDDCKSYISKTPIAFCPFCGRKL